MCTPVDFSVGLNEPLIRRTISLHIEHLLRNLRLCHSLIQLLSAVDPSLHFNSFQHKKVRYFGVGGGGGPGGGGGGGGGWHYGYSALGVDSSAILCSDRNGLTGSSYCVRNVSHGFVWPIQLRMFPTNYMFEGPVNKPSRLFFTCYR